MTREAQVATLAGIGLRVRVARAGVEFSRLTGEVVATVPVGEVQRLGRFLLLLPDDPAMELGPVGVGRVKLLLRQTGIGRPVAVGG